MSRNKSATAAKRRASSFEPEPIPVSDSDFSISTYEALAAEGHFDEPMRGLRTRELVDAELFQHYFGSGR